MRATPQNIHTVARGLDHPEGLHFGADGLLYAGGVHVEHLFDRLTSLVDAGAVQEVAQ